MSHCSLAECRLWPLHPGFIHYSLKAHVKQCTHRVLCHPCSESYSKAVQWLIMQWWGFVVAQARIISGNTLISIPVSILDGQPLVPEYLSLGFAMFPELPQRCPHSSSLSRGFTIHHLVLESLLSMSVGFHSEYNDRTERGTQDLECSLSCQTIYNPSLWAQKWRCATVDCTPSLALRMLCS